MAAAVDIRVHRFAAGVSALGVPQQFTFPFHYVPHPLSVAAAQQVRAYVATHAEWAAELARGKMLGVLVVRDGEGRLGFLAAFSGLLDGKNDIGYFVPPVYNLLEPRGEFKQGEAEITAINHQIERMEHDEGLRQLRHDLAEAQAHGRQVVEQYRSMMAKARASREKQRQAGNLSDEQREQLISESQFQKAELKRLKKRTGAQVAGIEAEIKAMTSEIEALRVQRRLMSERLQGRIFSLFVVSNARGEQRDLSHIFADFYARNRASGGPRFSITSPTPPSGAGECCAPKLLQWAYGHGLKPVCMAEFWCGRSPAGLLRHDGEFYPACQGKCLPILSFMLQGLDVEQNPLERHPADDEPLSILYDDQWLVAIDKPAGMLSMPGKLHDDSLLARLRKRYPTATGPMVVHRLDMATSGIVLAAKDLDTFRALQRQFAAHTISKRYVAVLQGWPAEDEGTISLPLRPDPLNRPMQVMDPEHGKPAITHYRVLSRNDDGTTRVEFTPQTGRTHQLRMHAALPQGLGCPIVGDMLYGHPARRLLLHAQRITFVHPATGQPLTIESPEPF